MRNASTWGRRTFTSVLAVGVAAGAATLTGTLPAAAEPGAVPAALQKAPENPDAPKDSPADTLGSHDAGLLADAEAEGKARVTVIIAADKGKTADVAAKVKSLGGTVSRRFDQVGYVLASVPTGKVLKTAKLPGIAAVDLDETIKLPEPEVAKPGEAAVKQAAVLPAAPGADTPAVNPYMPADEIGSVKFKTANPAYDGRGITIGIMDSGVDLDHPALQKTTTGERKIVDWVTATDPVTEGDGTWLRMTQTATGPAFTYAGVQWKAPAGNFKVGTFREAVTAGGEPKGDINRDGDTSDAWGVLYDPASKDIRVDVNGNRDFTDDVVMRPYKEKFQVGHFGTDNPATPIQESSPFVVEYRTGVDLTPAGGTGTADYVSIGLVEGLHGSHVAGIAAGNDLFGNAAFDGQAPGAKIVSSRACTWTGGCTNAALTTGMIDLVINRKVDVINMSIGGLPALNDANNARARLYTQLINDYGVQMFISAGNSGPGMNTIGDPSVASDVVSVAASISKETWLSNYGSVTRRDRQLFPFSSRGPAEDGGFKPNLTAPGSAISLTPLWQNETTLPTVGYTLPPGYTMANGTSMSSPQAAGGAALLLSAAKATDLGVTPAALRRALYTSADLIPGESVTGQGNGQMNVPAAWTVLAKNAPVKEYTSSAPVCTALSGFLATPGQGAGIYNRCAADAGGFKPGQTKTVDVTITRTSGAKKAIKHNLVWVGDNKAFTSAATVSLPLNKAVTIPVTVKAKNGASAAILRVDDPATPVVDFEVLNTVLAGSPAAAPSYATTVSGTVDRNSTQSFFVTVPEGASALQVDLSGIATGAQTRWTAINPWGVPVEDNGSPNCYTNYSDAAVCKPQERSYENPMPGVWELEVEARRTSPALNNPFKLTAKIQGTTVEPATVTLPSVKAGQPTAVTWKVENKFGPLALTTKGGPLGSSKQDRPTIADGESQEYTVEVPAGAQRLDVKIGNTADAAADLDLSVLKDGAVVASQADGDSEEAVSIPNPAAGTYTVVVDGYAVPADTTAYDYLDVFFNPALGGVNVPASTVALAAGANTTVAGVVTAASVPPAGRSLFGEMTVVTDEGAVVGRGSVAITAVTP